MPHAHYTTDDLLADESFQAFVLEGAPDAAAFWQGWLLAHPAREADFHAAVAVLETLRAQPAAAPSALKQAELRKLWQELQRPAPLLAPVALRVGRGRKRLQWALGGLTASLLLLGGYGWWQRPAAVAPALARYATAAGEQRILTLPDHSQVVLNGGSALRLASAWQPGQAREVWLTGEAYFTVQHTAPAALKAVAAAPQNVKFVVHTEHADVAVLGTRFDVLSRAGKTKVVLDAGQVQLSRQQNGQLQQVLLQPGELVEYDEAAPPAALATRAVQTRLYSAWTGGQLDFDNTPVSEIIVLLQDSYGLKFTLRNPALLQQKLTGSVPNQNLDVLLTAFGKSLDVKVRRKGHQVWLD